MEINFFLFVSFVLALISLYYFSSDLLRGMLINRKKRVLNNILMLKTDLKFAELDRKKAYQEYILDKDKNDDWQVEAHNAYLSFYNDKKKIYEAHVAIELRKKHLIFLAKKIEKKKVILEKITSYLIDQIKSKDLQIKINFEQLIKNI